MTRNLDDITRAKMGLDVALWAIAILFGTHAALTLLPAIESKGRYSEISAGQQTCKSMIDWPALRMQNPDIAAWIKVDGTNIDYPVVKPGGGMESDWYLSHDFWSKTSPLGCPYLDSRSSPDGDHAIVYGHHLMYSDQMFSDVHLAYDQTSFDKIGSARWFTPKTGVATFTPALALKVDRRYAAIQHFEFNSSEELSEWLMGLETDARATSKSLVDLSAEATRALTLSTCSSGRPGERYRTLLVFVA